MLSYFSGRFDTSGSILPLLVPEIEGGHSASEGGRFRQISIVSEMLFFSLYGYFRLLYTCFQHQNLLYFNL